LLHLAVTQTARTQKSISFTVRIAVLRELAAKGKYVAFFAVLFLFIKI
jgi:hypothetical protein